MAKCRNKNKILAENILPHSSPNHNTRSGSKMNYGNGLLFQSLQKVSKVQIKIQLKIQVKIQLEPFLLKVYKACHCLKTL